MHPQTRLIHTLLCCVLLWLPTWAQAKSIALLIGINTYQHARPLEGAVNDVEVLKKVLTTKWGFAASDIRTLTEQNATHANILRELNALQTRSAAGDFVLVYFSGHGTSATDTSSSLALPHTSGAFVPVDLPAMDSVRKMDQAALEKVLIVGRTHLRPIFTKLEQDRQVFVISDACYSGNMVRSLKSGQSMRYLPIQSGGDSMASTQPIATAAPVVYPYKRLVFLSASSEGQPALDINKELLTGNPTLDNKPHGAMTDALLRVFTGKVPADINGDGRLNYAEVHQAVLQFMATRGYDQVPQRLPSLNDDTRQSTAALLFGMGVPQRNLPVVQANAQVTLHLADNLSHLQSELASISGISFVPANQAAHLNINRSVRGIELRSAADEVILTVPKVNSTLLRRIAAEVWWRGLVVRTRPSFQVEIETNPSTRGNTFLNGERFVFNAKTSQAAALIILSLNAAGEVSVLYPQTPRQQNLHAANQLLTLPETEKIQVTPPFGVDQVLILALPALPSDWGKIEQIATPVAITDPRLRALEPILAAQNGKFAWQLLNVRTYQALAK